MSTLQTAKPSSPTGNAVLLQQAPDCPERLHLPLVESPRPQAGFPSPAADYVDRPLDLNELLVTNPPATFYARVEGRSLVDLGIMDNDIVIVDRSIDARPGKVILAVADGDHYVKVLGKIEGRLALLSRNEKEAADYQPLFIDKFQDFEVFGVVTGVARTL